MQTELVMIHQYKEIITHDIPNVSIIDPGILCSNQGILNLTTLNDSTLYL